MKSSTSRGKSDKIIIALLEQGSIEKAAVALGISDVTIWRWLKNPEFQRAYQQARREAFSRSLARMQYASGVAVSTLLKVMLDKEAPAASRVRAADSVLGHAVRAYELENIEARVDELERVTQSKAAEVR